MLVRVTKDNIFMAGSKLTPGAISITTSGIQITHLGHGHIGIHSPVPVQSRQQDPVTILPHTEHTAKRAQPHRRRPHAIWVPSQLGRPSLAAIAPLPTCAWDRARRLPTCAWDRARCLTARTISRTCSSRAHTRT